MLKIVWRVLFLKRKLICFVFMILQLIECMGSKFCLFLDLKSSFDRPISLNCICFVSNVNWLEESAVNFKINILCVISFKGFKSKRCRYNEISELSKVIKKTHTEGR